jgi:hypothetical protein
MELTNSLLGAQIQRQNAVSDPVISALWIGLQSSLRRNDRREDEVLDARKHRPSPHILTFVGRPGAIAGARLTCVLHPGTTHSPKASHPSRAVVPPAAVPPPPYPLAPSLEPDPAGRPDNSHLKPADLLNDIPKFPDPFLKNRT